MLASGKREGEIFQGILRAVLRGDTMSGSYNARGEIGEWYEEGLYVMAVFDNDGRAAYYIATLAEHEELRSEAS